MGAHVGLQPDLRFARQQPVQLSEQPVALANTLTEPSFAGTPENQGMFGKAGALHKNLGAFQAVDLDLGIVGRSRACQGKDRVLQFCIPQAENFVVPGHPAQVRITAEAAFTAQPVAHPA